VRGDGPAGRPAFDLVRAFSPRAWGWSVPQTTVPPSPRVLPTCVGMVLHPL